MKKTLVSALTTALVVSAASTTFAASNPFSDVPADHWAYDAVSQLAADGVIEGYGDSTFQGDKNITRYEMAQMVAKAMAKKDVSAADKAMIDKLAAEFADELNNLGVRVANLEKHADNVKFNGELRYRYWSTRDEHTSDHRDNHDALQYRLLPTADVNDHWQVKARFTGNVEMSKDTTSDARLTYAYADGKYKNFEIMLGKQSIWSDADQGLVTDDYFSGVTVAFGNKLKTTLGAGRWNLSNANSAINAVGTDQAASYQGIDVTGEAGKFRGGVGYRHFSSDTFKSTANGYSKAGDLKDDANIWSVGAGYKFDNNWNLFGAYAKNTEAENFAASHSLELDYKGVNKANAGTWGAHVAYRYVAQNVSFMPTFDTFGYLINAKGWEFGADYIPMHNVLTTVEYFGGKNLADDKDANVLYGRLSYFF